jgi:hypothetical protein
MSALRLTLYCRLDAPVTLGAADADAPVVGVEAGATVGEAEDDGLTASVGALDAVALEVGDWDTADDGVGDSDADGDEGLFWVVAK